MHPGAIIFPWLFADGDDHDHDDGPEGLLAITDDGNTCYQGRPQQATGAKRQA